MQVSRHEHDVILQPSTLSDLGFEARFTQVQSGGIGDLLLMILDTVKANKKVSAILCIVQLIADREKNLRPVELPKLDQSKLKVASLMFQESLTQGRHATRNILDGRELNRGDVRSDHGGNRW